MASVSRLPSIRRPANKSRPVSSIEKSTPNPNNVAAEPESTTKAKRRSLLPQFHRKGSDEERHEPGIQEEDEDGSSRTPSEDTRGSGESLGRRGIDEDRRTMPPSSRHSRPMSMIPPRGASQHAKTKTNVSLSRALTDGADDGANADAETARAQSLAALTGAAGSATLSKLAMPGSTLTRVNSTHPPQSPRLGGPTIPSRTTSTRPIHAHSRTLSSNPSSTAMTSIAEKQSSTAIARPPSQTETEVDSKPRGPSPRSSVMSRPRPMSHMPAAQTSPPRAAPPARTRPTSQMIMPPPARPNFTTYQQHYSPAKTALPKPPVPSSKIAKPLTPDEGVDVTFDVTKQQMELLQLSLLHQAAAMCKQEYTTSARKKLSRKHTKLRKDYEGVRAVELVQQRTCNLAALESWCRDPGLLVENLQILSLVYSDLTALIEEGGRHGDVVSMFELWMNETESPESGVLVRPLPEDWKAAHASQALRLRSIQRNLRVLPPPGETSDSSSGLAVALKGCETLVEGMMKELEVMVKLEKELLAREKTRLEEDVKALVLDDVGMQSWVPAWQKA